SWIPKITDFGLAKQVDVSQVQTQSGAIMGTPTYMAPEQAAGRIRDVGPHTDVYALGVILYEMLTGRVPFRGPTPMETLDQVRFRDPVPPSRLQPRVHRDLETICLKALAKEPDRRYVSALALADDLARFQAGDAIMARRDSVGRQVLRKVQRHPVKLAAVPALVAAIVVAGYFAIDAGRTSHEKELLQRISDGLEVQEWSPENAEAMESLVAELAQWNPNQASEAQKRLYQRVAAHIQDGYSFKNKPVLQPTDIGPVNAM